MPSLLWNTPFLLAAKHSHNMMLPLPCFTAGMVLWSLQGSTFSFFFFPNMKRTILTNECSLSVIMCICTVAFFLAVWLFSIFLGIIILSYGFSSIFRWSLDVLASFVSGTQKPSASWMVWWLYGADESQRYPKINQTWEGEQLFWFSHDALQWGPCVWRHNYLKIHPQVCLRLTQMESVSLSEASHAKTPSCGILQVF